MPLPSVTKALLSAEAFPPSLRDWFAERGITGYQCYGTADLGLIAYETAAREGLVMDEGVIVEIVRPGTGDPVPEGEVGELVITTLNTDYPLIRFGTGDLSAILPGTCPTGRTNTRIKGWMGRADQTTKVRGLFVHPGQVASITSRFPQVLRARLIVRGEMANDQMVLQVETTETAGAWHRACKTPSARSPSCAAKSNWWRLAPCPTTARSSRTHAATADTTLWGYAPHTTSCPRQRCGAACRERGGPLAQRDRVLLRVLDSTGVLIHCIVLLPASALRRSSSATAASSAATAAGICAAVTMPWAVGSLPMACNRRRPWGSSKIRSAVARDLNLYSIGRSSKIGPRQHTKDTPPARVAPTG